MDNVYIPRDYCGDCDKVSVEKILTTLFAGEKK